MGAISLGTSKIVKDSLSKTVGLLQKFHIPLDFIAESLIEYTAEFCVQANYPDPKKTFSEAIRKAIANQPKINKPVG